MSKSNEAPCNDCGQLTTYYLYDVAICTKCHNYERVNIISGDFKNGYNRAVEDLISIIKKMRFEEKTGDESINQLLTIAIDRLFENHFSNPRFIYKR